MTGPDIKRARELLAIVLTPPPPGGWTLAQWTTWGEAERELMDMVPDMLTELELARALLKQPDHR